MYIFELPQKTVGLIFFINIFLYLSSKQNCLEIPHVHNPPPFSHLQLEAVNKIIFIKASLSISTQNEKKQMKKTLGKETLLC